MVADKEGQPFSVDRGTKQGDPVSPTLFNAVVEVLMRKLKSKWAKKRWGMDVDFGWPKQLQNLRFADDLILVGKTLGQATQMLGDLMVEAGKVGLGVHAGKTKILSNVRQRRGAEREKEVEVRGQKVEMLPLEGGVAYLGRKFTFYQSQDVELEHRISRGWAKFAVYKGELCDKRYSLLHRLRLFGAVVAPTVLYGSGTWTMTAEREKKLKGAQRKMLRRMLNLGRRRPGAGAGAEATKSAENERKQGKDDSSSTTSSSSRDSSSNSNTSSSSSTTTSSDEPEEEAEEEEEAEDEGKQEPEKEEEKKEEETWVEWIVRATRVGDAAMRRAKVADWVEEQKRRKWRWAGHVARRKDSRWTVRLMDWEPWAGARSVGRPEARWEDSLRRFESQIGTKWRDLAQDRGSWDRWEQQYVRSSACA